MIIRRLESNAKSVYGNGIYTTNVKQNGVILQPQTYIYNGSTYFNTIVVTANATINVDSTLKSSVAMFNNLIILEGGTLSAETNSKCLELHVYNTLINNGKIHMDYLGYPGNFGNLTPNNFIPSNLLKYVNTYKLNKYIFLGEGANGADALYSYGVGNTGAFGGAMQTGGGGSGAVGLYSDGAHTGKGGKGGPCCGGAGSGGSHRAHGISTSDAGDYGGPGSNAYVGADGGSAGGGAGNPVGAGTWNGNGNGQPPIPPQGCGGGILAIFASTLYNNASGIISAKGAMGGAGTNLVVSLGGGGSAGGGIICIVTRKYTNAGIVQASGGPKSLYTGYTASGEAGGPGGDGSINIFSEN